MWGEVAMFFRDRELSDAIGFRYARADAKSAVADLIGRIAAAGDATVTLPLDGQNPSEHYPQSGELLLNELYGQLHAQAPRGVSVPPRAESAARPPRGRSARRPSRAWLEPGRRIW